MNALDLGLIERIASSSQYCCTVRAACFTAMVVEWVKLMDLVVNVKN